MSSSGWKDRHASTTHPDHGGEEDSGDDGLRAGPRLEGEQGTPARPKQSGLLGVSQSSIDPVLDLPLETRGLSASSHLGSPIHSHHSSHLLRTGSVVPYMQQPAFLKSYVLSAAGYPVLKVTLQASAEAQRICAPIAVLS
jgi:hypothetical protein